MDSFLGKEYGTVLINIGRSNVIKEDELLEALEKNWIREAILDVFDTGKKYFQSTLLAVLLIKNVYIIKCLLIKLH